MERNQELQALIKRMEQQYDADETAREETTPSSSLSPEVEQFLQEMDRRFSDPEQPGGGT